MLNLVLNDLNIKTGGSTCEKKIGPEMCKYNYAKHVRSVNIKDVQH